MVNIGLFVLELRGIMGTDLCALSASDTQILICMRLSGTVHLHLACTGTAAHSDVFQSAAESGSFMAFKMSQGNKYVCIHDCTADLRFFYILAALHGYQLLICSFQAVCDQNLAAGCERMETV